MTLKGNSPTKTLIQDACAHYRAKVSRGAAVRSLAQRYHFSDRYIIDAVNRVYTGKESCKS